MNCILLALNGLHCNTTGIQFLNHTDKNNKGLSAIMILGDFKGGSLCVPGRGFRTPDGKSGIVAIIDGTELHHSEPFKGTRDSIAAFVHNACERLNSYQVEQLEN